MMEGSGLERVLESPVYIRAWLGGRGRKPRGVSNLLSCVGCRHLSSCSCALHSTVCVAWLGRHIPSCNEGTVRTARPVAPFLLP